MSEQSLTATDNRTGKSHMLPIENDMVRAMDLRKIKTDETRFRAHDLRSRANEHGVH
jgi:hypothetical protein